MPDGANTTWVKPKLVAEVKFTEWTAAGEMRHPVFLGLRTDKKATESDPGNARTKALPEAGPSQDQTGLERQTADLADRSVAAGA